MIKDSACIRIEARLWKSAASSDDEDATMKQAVIASCNKDVVTFSIIICFVMIEKLLQLSGQNTALLSGLNEVSTRECRFRANPMWRFCKDVDLLIPGNSVGL